MVSSSKYFEGKIFTNNNQFVKFVKIFPLEENPLYGTYIIVVILVSTFGHLLVVVVKDSATSGIVLVLSMEGIVLLLLLVITIIVNQVQCTKQVTMHIF